MVGDVVQGLRRAFGAATAVIVVDDGSSDDTAEVAARAGADLVRHARNRGKGAALRSGLGAAHALGVRAVVTVDADGQHPPDEALGLHARAPDLDALVLGVRDLAAAGAPHANQRSNAFSNLVLSAFVGRRLADTQCGLRRYPLAATLALGGREDGYGYEAEVLIRALAAGVPLVELPVTVIYPPEHLRVTHFDSVRDPAKIVRRVLATVAETRLRALGAAARRLVGP
ncbi:MAG: glycosyltransferase family 2 protein [Myxococcales bacterium]|nr:glycosyltransferase family 2 protein [Myxococcales bacterium]